MFNSLAVRLVSLVVVAVLFIVISTGYLYYKYYTELLSENTVRLIQQDVSAASVRFERQANEVSSFLKLLLLAPPLAKFEDSDGELLDSRLLGELFESFIESRVNYYQVQFVPSAGIDVPEIYVSRRENETLIIKEDLYTSFLKPEYYARVADADRHEVVTSRIILLRDLQGEVIQPARPTMLFSAPVKTEDGTLLGFLTILVNARAILMAERASVQALIEYLPGSQHYIVTGDGDYVLNPDHSREMSYEFGHRNNAIDDWPEFSSVLSAQAKETTVFYSQEGEAVIVSPFNVGGEKAPHYMYTLFSTPMGVLFADLYRLQMRTIVFTMILVLFVVLLSGSYIRRRLEPLKQLSDAMETYHPSEQIDPLPVVGGDEVSSVTQSFNYLADQLRELFLYESSVREGLNRISLVSTMDFEGNFLEVNDNFAKVSGYSRDELIGRPASMFRSGLVKEEEYQAMWAAVAKGKIWRSDMAHRVRDGSLVWLESALVPLSDSQGRYVKLLNIQTDLTERKQLLEAVEKEKVKAEHASRVKSDFLASMSHELRTPLNSIIGFSQRLKRKLSGDIDPRHMDAIETVERNGQHLLQIINEILDVAKIESGKMELNPSDFDLNGLLGDAMSTISTLAKGKGLSLVKESTDDVVTVVQDKKKTHQILLNLLSNAVKYTNEGGVTVCLTHEFDHVIIEVKDTGIGIKEKDISRLFTRFTQLESTITQRVEGTGLGLVLANEFTVMQGGEISVTSEYGIGSCFAVKLPTRVVPIKSE